MKALKKGVRIAHQMAADGAMKEGLQTKSFVHMALMTVGTDTFLPGPARVLNPLLKTVAWFARKAGVDRRLEEKYLRPSQGDVAAA
jgi:hypothetical protein